MWRIRDESIVYKRKLVGFKFGGKNWPCSGLTKSLSPKWETTLIARQFFNISIYVALIFISELHENIEKYKIKLIL